MSQTENSSYKTYRKTGHPRDSGGGQGWEETEIADTVRVDLCAIVDEIINSLPGSLDDWDFDGDNIVIQMSDRALADVWHCRQTLYEPEEHEIELKAYVEDDVDVNKEVLEALHCISKIETSVEVDYESIEIDEDYGPDPDRAYDEWRDRQGEE